MAVVSWNRAGWHKLTLWIVAVLTLLLVLAAVASMVIERKLPDKLRATVYDESNGLYKLTFRSLKVSLWRGGMAAYGIALRPDASRYSTLADSLRPSSIYAIQAKAMHISGASLWRYLLQEKIKISALKVEAPKLTVTHLRPDSVSSEEPEKSLYGAIPKFLHGTQVGHITLDSVSLQWLDKRSPKAVTSSRMEKFTVEVNSFMLDSASLADDDKVFFAKDIQLNSNGLHYEEDGGMYHFSTGRIHLSTKAEVLMVTDFRCRPLYPEMEFARRLVYKGDRFDIHIPRFSMDQLDFKQMENAKSFKAKRVNIDSALLKVFAHKGMPEDPNKGAAEFPAIAFQKLALSVNIDTIIFKQSNVHYREYNPKAKRIGEVNFQGLNGTISHVTNIDTELQKDKWVRFLLDAQFMGAAKLDLNINMDMTDPNAAFNYKGSLAPRDLSFANSFLEPLALIRIEQGSLQGLHFQVSGNKFGTQSNVTILYRDLKVAALREDSGDIEKRGLFSLFVNWLKVNGSNPRKEGEQPVHSTVRYDHPPERSFFNLLWKSLMAGMQDTAMK